LARPAPALAGIPQEIQAGSRKPLALALSGILLDESVRQTPGRSERLDGLRLAREAPLPPAARFEEHVDFGTFSFPGAN
jgi:hypothetical protein